MRRTFTQSLVREKLKDGDWVSGKSVNDEKFHGYIEALDALSGTAKVKVTECDNEGSIGRTVECYISTLELLPQGVLNEEGQLRNLIDLALSVRDQAWFFELTSELINVRRGRSVKSIVPGRNEWL